MKTKYRITPYTDIRTGETNSYLLCMEIKDKDTGKNKWAGIRSEEKILAYTRSGKAMDVLKWFTDTQPGMGEKIPAWIHEDLDKVFNRDDRD